jgi:hypothetical protein
MKFQFRFSPIAWLVGLFILCGVIYALATPLFEISDELWHYPMVKTLADGNGLPVQDPQNVGLWRQEGSQPPLYYALMAAATFWIDTSDMTQVRWVNPHTDNGVITPDRNNNIVIHRPDELTRWRGTALAVRLIRWLSVLLGAGTVYFTYRFALELLPGRTALALAAAGFAAFTPMFLFISASVNNDNLAICLSSAALWLMARWLRQPPTRVSWSHVALGLVLGAGALSKQSALGLLCLAGLVLFFIHFRSLRLTFDALRSFFPQFLIVFGLAFLTAFWWYWRNWQLYGDWLGWNRFIQIVGPRAQPATLAQVWGERVGFVQAYWGLFGGVSVPMPDWIYTVLNLVIGLALIGLLIGLIRVVLLRRTTLTKIILWTLPVAWLGLIIVGLLRWTSLTWASQGRLIFPAISAISWLVVFGLAQLGQTLQPRHFSFSLSILFPGLGVIFMALTAWLVPFTVIAPHYVPPPSLTLDQINRVHHRLDADFSGEMKLLGYDLRTDTAHPGEAVHLTLYWQSLIAMDRNWSVFVHLVDSDDIILAQRDRYPGQGLLATTLLYPGQTFADDYVIPIPATAYAPAHVQIQVGLYDLLDGARLPVSAGGDALSFGSVELLATPLTQNFDNKIALTGYDLAPRVLRPAETLTVTLNWQALAAMQVNYSISVRVRDANLNKWAARDSWPVQGAAPTSLWNAGQSFIDPYPLTLSPATPPGQYDVEVIIYDSATLLRLRLVTADGRLTDADSLILSKIRVTTP